jgi:hypothetical protein
VVPKRRARVAAASSSRRARSRLAAGRPCKMRCGPRRSCALGRFGRSSSQGAPHARPRLNGAGPLSGPSSSPLACGPPRRSGTPRLQVQRKPLRLRRVPGLLRRLLRGRGRRVARRGEPRRHVRSFPRRFGRGLARSRRLGRLVLLQHTAVLMAVEQCTHHLRGHLRGSPLHALVIRLHRGSFLVPPDQRSTPRAILVG